jgi:dienelactone hydrolase
MTMARLWRADSFWIRDEHGATRATWFSPTERDRLRRVGVLVLHGVGQEEEAVSVGAPEISGAAAARGLLTLAIDFAGSGQSFQGAAQANATQAWRRQIVEAIQHLRRNGADKVAVIAPRLAAALAIAASATERIDALVLWSPVLSGKRYVRELRLLQGTAASDAAASGGGIVVGGFTLPGAVVDSIAALDATAVDAAPAPEILYLESPERAVDQRFVERLRALGAKVEARPSVETANWLYTASDNATVPVAEAGKVAAWIDGKLASEGTAAPVDAASLATSTSFPFGGSQITESFVRIGKLGLSGVVSEPSAPDPSRAAVLFLSTIGPGRSFVREARRAASEGRLVLRFDFAGFGLSPLHPDQDEPELYGHTGARDVRLAVEYLLSRGAPSVFIVGFCAGAWSSLVCEPLRGVVGIAAINVHLHVRPRKLAQRSKNNQTWQRELAAPTKRTLFEKVRDRVDRLPLLAGPAVAWLNAHRQAGAALAFFFDSHDLGYQYWDGVLAGLFGRELARRGIEVRTYPGLGHLAEGEQARVIVYEDIHSFIERRDPVGNPISAASRQSS